MSRLNVGFAAEGKVFDYRMPMVTGDRSAIGLSESRCRGGCLAGLVLVAGSWLDEPDVVGQDDGLYAVA